METTLEQISRTVGAYIPNLVGALLILILGWLVARAIGAVVTGALRRTNLDNRLAQWVAGDQTTSVVPIEQWIGNGVFYLLMIFVLVAFFQALQLTLPIEPLNRLLNQLFEFAPQLLGAGLLLLVAWILATAIRLVISRLLGAAQVDERLAREVGREEGSRVSLTKTLADTAYWLVLLLFLPAVLNALALQGLLGPVQGMIDKILNFLPNIFSAGVIVGIGWLVACIVRGIVTNLLVAIGTDRLSERVGLAPALGTQRLSGILGTIIYILILIPVLIAALQALALEAITRPASNMLNTILSALPAIFASVLIIALAYVVASVTARLVTNLLTGVGFNAILAHLGFRRVASTGQRTPSEIAGFIVLVTIMLLASVEAVRQLGFVVLADLIARFTVFAGEVALGLIIFAIGLYLAGLAAATVESSGAAQSELLALAARLSILVLAGAMALRQMGLANEIISLAFGLLLGAIAVAVALAFGLGARDIAARELEEWIRTIKSRKS